MRRSAAAIAVIRRQENGQTLWLAQWNEGWEGFHFVGGHKYTGESFLECVAREITEELGLSSDKFVVSENPLAQVSYIARSRSAQEDTLYTMELFEVQLCDTAVPRVNSDPKNRWLTERDIRQQHCEDGTAVSPTMLLFFTEAGLWAE